MTVKLVIEAMSHHVLHVWGSRVDAAPQLVVQLEDLLTVGPEDCSSTPAASCVAGAVLLCFSLVAAQQFPELLGVWQEGGSWVPDTQHQEWDNVQPGHGSAGHSDTFRL